MTCTIVRFFLAVHPVEGRVDDLAELLASGAVQSLKVVDSDGCHVLNLAVQHQQDAVIQVESGGAGLWASDGCGSWRPGGGGAALI
jgi:hypothetical protein